jgi:hypothetical protein
MRKGKFDVFLSYAWGKFPSDWRKDLVDMLFVALRNQGYKVWMDASKKDGSLHMKKDLINSMKSGVENSSCVVVCLSSDYLASGPCRLELTHALDLEKDIVLCMMEPEEQGFLTDWKKEISCEPTKDGSSQRSYHVKNNNLAVPDTCQDPKNPTTEESLCLFLRQYVKEKKYSNDKICNSLSYIDSVYY